MTSKITGPGEDPRERLLTNIRVLKGSAMSVETGDAQGILFLELTSRSLGELSEAETHHFGMSADQALWTAAQLVQRVLDLDAGQRGPD